MSKKAAGPAKTRGRPKTYDPDRALWAALEQFWAGGFASTSLDELAASTGMNRPSLYAAFGDKKALYLKTLARFTEELRKALGTELFKHKTVGEALDNFYGTALDLYLEGTDGGPRGCFIVCTAPTEARNDRDIRVMLESILKEIDDGLELRFTLAQKKGEIAVDADPAALAKVAGGTLHSLAIRSRAGEPREALNKMARQMVALIAPAKFN